MNNKIFSLVFLGLILAVVFVSGCTKPAEVGLDFSAKPCDESIDVFDNSAFGVKETVWLDDSTLQVKAFVSLNCAIEEVSGGDFEIAGDKITLYYNAPECGPLCTLCNCAHEITYTFSNLEKKDYSFELERVK